MEFDIGYFDALVKQSAGLRQFRNRLLAWEPGQDLYDGGRETGYCGFRPDGRWLTLIPKLAERYGLSGSSAVLDLGCKKGFFLHDLKHKYPGIKARGIENHPYPVEHGLDGVRGDISIGDFTALPYDDGEFDFVLAFLSIYMLNLGDVVKILREIQRVGKGRSYITCGAYRTPEEREVFARWNLLGTTVLHVDEWRELFDYAGYTGDYYFTTASSLNLVAG